MLSVSTCGDVQLDLGCQKSEGVPKTIIHLNNMTQHAALKVCTQQHWAHYPLSDRPKGFHQRSSGFTGRYGVLHEVLTSSDLLLVRPLRLTAAGSTQGTRLQRDLPET